MNELYACRRGFQTAAGVFAHAVLAQSVVLTAALLIGGAFLF